MRRWIITHWTGSMRVSTFVASARSTFTTKEKCEEYIELAREVLERVIGDATKTLRATEVECWDHGDPKRSVFAAED